MTASCVSTLNPAPRDANVENALVFLSVKEEFRACFLKREDPKALMAKHGVNFAVVKKWLVEVINERTEERQLKTLAREHAYEYYTTTKGDFDQYEVASKQIAAMVKDSQDSTLKLMERIPIAIEILRHSSRSVDELDEASNNELISSLIGKHIDFQKSVKNLNEMLLVIHQKIEENRREKTRALLAFFDAEKLEKDADKELEDLEQWMVCFMANLGNQTTSPGAQKADEAGADKKKLASEMWLDRFRNFIHKLKQNACIEP